jgi:hypothetical protein
MGEASIAAGHPILADRHIDRSEAGEAQFAIDHVDQAHVVLHADATGENILAADLVDDRGQALAIPVQTVEIDLVARSDRGVEEGHIRLEEAPRRKVFPSSCWPAGSGRSDEMDVSS